MRKTLLSALPLALVLVACQGKEAPPTEQATPAAPEAKPGTELSGARLLLPAVKSNPAAVYFRLENRGAKPVTLAAVAVSRAAMAEMHETKGGSMAKLTQLEIKPGETVEFKPGGMHVMVFGLDPVVGPGVPVEITLIFADGDKISAPLRLEVPGAGTMDDGGMAGMDMSGH